MKKEETLLYADIGAISFTPKPCVNVDIDDQRVEYSQVIFNAKRDTPVISPSIQPTQNVGMYALRSNKAHISVNLSSLINTS